jgi:hypothetical protein
VKRRLIASYGADRLLIADLCDLNHDEWKICDLLNTADLLRAILRGVGLEVGQPRKMRACGPSYCVEVEAVAGGFLAYEVEQ